MVAKQYLGIVQLYHPSRGFGYVLYPLTNEEFHFTNKEIRGAIREKERVWFSLQQVKGEWKASNIIPYHDATNNENTK